MTVRKITVADAHTWFRCTQAPQLKAASSLTINNKLETNIQSAATGRTPYGSGILWLRAWRRGEDRDRAIQRKKKRPKQIVKYTRTERARDAKQAARKIEQKTVSKKPGFKLDHQRKGASAFYLKTV